jgi:hypothetical protein
VSGNAPSITIDDSDTSGSPFRYLAIIDNAASSILAVTALTTIFEPEEFENLTFDPLAQEDVTVVDDVDLTKVSIALAPGATTGNLNETGATGTVYRISLTNSDGLSTEVPSGKSVRVLLAFDGKAQNGVDYDFINALQVIPAGQSFVDVVVQAIDDGNGEGGIAEDIKISIAQIDDVDATFEQLEISSVGSEVQVTTAIEDNDDLIAELNNYEVAGNTAITGNIILDVNEAGAADSDSATRLTNPADLNNVITAGSFLNYDAIQDDSNDAVWKNLADKDIADILDEIKFTNTSGAGPDPTLSILPEADTQYLNLQGFYSFGVDTSTATNVNRITQADTEDLSRAVKGARDPNPSNNATRSDGTIELWIKSVDSLSTEIQVLYETGANGQGTAITLQGTTVGVYMDYKANTNSGNKNNPILLEFDLEKVGIDPSADFVQLVVTVDTNDVAAGQGEVSLFANGTLMEREVTNNTDTIFDWGGGD